MRALILAIAFLAQTAQAQVPKVVTDIAPVQSLTALVMGDLGQPGLLLDQSADPHSFQMRPSQARMLAGADAVIWMGLPLTPWLGDTLATLAPDARSLPLLDLSDMPMRIGASDTHVPDQGEPLDPHAWLDPLNAVYFLDAIAAELSRLDPANAATYAANAATASVQLTDLDTTMKASLVPLRDTPMIAYHDALRYLLKRYDLKLIGALSDPAGNAPGAARLSDLRTKVGQATEPGCILLEPAANPELIASIDPDGRFRVVAIDPLGVKIASGPDLYLEMMRAIADEMVSCAAR